MVLFVKSVAKVAVFFNMCKFMAAFLQVIFQDPLFGVIIWVGDVPEVECLGGHGGAG